MNKRTCSFLAVIFLFMLSFNLCSRSNADRKILILGFNSKYISNMQDRLLRETVLRELLKKGYSIVPVMALENYIKMNNTDIRSVDSSSVKDICSELNAGFAITGKIGKNKAGNQFVITLNIYDNKKNAENRIVINFTSKGKFNEICIPLAWGIADKIVSVLRGKKKK